MSIVDKRSFFIWVFTFSLYALNAQTFFSQQEENIIYYSPDIAPTAVCVGDIEGDGDQDILSFFDQKFRLYEHVDGKGIFVEQEIMAAPDDWILSVFISDLNGDGKEDVLAASYNNDEIIWYENGGDLTFGTRVSITDSARGAASVYAADLDKDGDQDVLSASIWDNKIAWYENLGSGNFSAQQIISNQSEGARYVFVSDLNGDGFPDVISASIYDNKIAWHENQGGGIFGQRQIITDSAARALCVYSADLDGDGDQDVLSASAWDDKIAWYNNDGSGNFGKQHVITDNLQSAQSVYAADLDGDGDKDVLSASLLDNKIAWYENTGTGNFGKQVLVSETADMPGFVYATDIDGDGHEDILSASTDFKIAWYENSLPLMIISNPKDTAVFPGQDAGFKIYAEASSAYQWQCNSGEGFLDLGNTPVYDGVQTSALEIRGAGYDLQGNQYRCVAINGTDSLNSMMASLSILDTIKPLISSYHPDTLMQSDAFCIAILPDFTEGVVAEDNSNGKPVITQTPVPWTKVYGSEVEVRLTASDGAGNSSYISFRVDVVDLTPPVFTALPETRELVRNENGQYVLPDYTDSIEVADNCSDISKISLSQEPAPAYVLPDSLSSLTLTFSAVDESGNPSQLSSVVYTSDQVPPVITSVHNDVRVEGSNQCSAYMPDFTGEVEASDNITGFSELVIEQAPEAQTLIYGQENQVTIKVTDKAGNTAEETFNVQVTNEISISCIGDKTRNLDEGQTIYKVSGNEFDPLDVKFQCGFSSLKNNINGSSTLDQVEFTDDTTRVVWTLSDDSGNIAQCSFNVILEYFVGVESPGHNGILVWPNPAMDKLNYESAEAVNLVSVTDMAGKVQLEITPANQAGSIDISDLVPGSYIISITTGKRLVNMTIVKE